MEALSLLLRGGFARPRPPLLAGLAGSWQSVSVPYHCIDAEIKRLTDQKLATPWTCT